jgi:hypothetical protein
LILCASTESPLAGHHYSSSPTYTYTYTYAYPYAYTYAYPYTYTYPIINSLFHRCWLATSTEAHHLDLHHYHSVVPTL